MVLAHKLITILVVQTIVLSKLTFKSSFFNSQSDVSPFKKKKKLINEEVYEDRALSTPHIMIVADGVSSSEFPAGLLADTLIYGILDYLFNPDKINQRAPDLAPSNLRNSSVELVLKLFINDSVKRYNEMALTHGLDSKQVKASTTLVGCYISYTQSSSSYTFFQYGDSLIMIFRMINLSDGLFMMPVLESEAQQKDFNFPSQISSIKTMGEENKLQITKVKAKEGDLVMIGSDGLFDNLPSALISICVNFILFMINESVKQFGEVIIPDPANLLTDLIRQYIEVIEEVSTPFLKLKLIEAFGTWDLVVKESSKIPKVYSNFPSTKEELEAIVNKSTKDENETTTPDNYLFFYVKDKFAKVSNKQKRKRNSREKSNGQRREGSQPNKGGNRVNTMMTDDPFHNSIRRVINSVTRSSLTIPVIDHEQITDIRDLNNIDMTMLLNVNSMASTNSMLLTDSQMAEEITSQEVLKKNIFKLFGCTISDFFYMEKGENDEIKYTECIIAILESLKINRQILEHYKPEIAVKALVNGANQISTSKRNIATPFMVHATTFKKMALPIPKNDDIGVSMSLVTRDPKKVNINEINKIIENKMDELNHTFNRYSAFFKTSKNKRIRI